MWHLISIVEAFIEHPSFILYWRTHDGLAGFLNTSDLDALGKTLDSRTCNIILREVSYFPGFGLYSFIFVDLGLGMQGKFILNGETINVHDVAPTTTVLEWLRSTGRSGTKEGCAEGDCGACTIAILDDESHAGPQWRGVCSCIMMLPQVFGKKLVTVEGLSTGNKLHPAQKAMVDALGSQCDGVEDFDANHPKSL